MTRCSVETQATSVQCRSAVSFDRGEGLFGDEFLQRMRLGSTGCAKHREAGRKPPVVGAATDAS